MQSTRITVDTGQRALHKHSAAAVDIPQCARAMRTPHRHVRTVTSIAIDTDGSRSRTARHAQAQLRCCRCNALCTCTGHCLWHCSTTANHLTAMYGQQLRLQSTRIAVDAWTARHASTAPLLSMQRAMHMHSALPVASKYRHRDHRTAMYRQQRRLQPTRIAVDTGQRAMHKHSAAAVDATRYAHAQCVACGVEVPPSRPPHRHVRTESRLQSTLIAIDAGWRAMHKHSAAACLWYRSIAANHRTAMYGQQRRLQWTQIAADTRTARPAQAQRRCYGCTALCTCTGRCLWRRSTAINHRTAMYGTRIAVDARTAHHEQAQRRCCRCNALCRCRVLSS